jgi:hypothetical protein
MPSCPTIRRLYVEIDGVLARLRRGSVRIEEKERQRPGDIYRELKVGAVFEAEPGRKRSALAPRVFVDSAGPKAYVAWRGSVKDFAPLLYTLAEQRGLVRARAVGNLGGWSSMDLESRPGALSHCGANCGSLARTAACLAGGQCSLWSQYAQRNGVTESQCQLLEEGNIEALVEAIALLPPLPPPPTSTRSIASASYRLLHYQRCSDALSLLACERHAHW